MVMYRAKEWLQKHDRDGLLFHSFIVTALQNAGGAINMIFHIVMGHALSAQQYGVLASMLASVLILGLPMLAVQNTLAHSAARFVQEGRAGMIRVLVRQWFKKLSCMAVVLIVVGVAASGYVANFFNIETRVPVMITSFVLAGTLLLSIIPGIMQSLQHFVWMCMTINTWGIVRTVVGAILVFAVARDANQGLIAQGAGIVAGVAVGVVGLRVLMKGVPVEQGDVSGHGEYFGKSFATLVFFAILMNADVLIVKHYFDALPAGQFAQAGTIGRTVIFLCQPIAMVLFPKVVSSGEFGEAHQRTLVRAIVLSALFVGAAVLVCCMVPWLPLRLMFGVTEPTAEQLRLVRGVIIAMGPLGITYVLTNFEMAQHRFACLVPLLLCAVAYMVGVSIWHSSLIQIVMVLGTVSLFSVAGLIITIPWEFKGLGHQAN